MSPPDYNVWTYKTENWQRWTTNHRCLFNESTDPYIKQGNTGTQNKAQRHLLTLRLTHLCTKQKCFNDSLSNIGKNKYIMGTFKVILQLV